MLSWNYASFGGNSRLKKLFLWLVKRKKTGLKAAYHVRTSDQVLNWCSTILTEKISHILYSTIYFPHN